MTGKARVAVVTGGSRGIGASIARGLTREGLFVIVGARDEARGSEVAEKVRGEFRALDLAREESIETFAAGVLAEHGGVDVLVNNAGASFDGFDAAVADRTLDVNFRGMVKLTDRLLPALRPCARVVMVSSGMGELGCLGGDLRRAFQDRALDRAGLEALVRRFVDDVAAGVHAEAGWPSNAYRVSKVAMNAYVRILARELQGDPRNILVNAACPGWVRTDLGGASAPRSPAEGAKTPIWLALHAGSASGGGEGGLTGGFFRDERPIDW